MDVVNYVQCSRYGAALDKLKRELPGTFRLILKKLSDKSVSAEEISRIAEFKSLRDLRPCIYTDYTS